MLLPLWLKAGGFVVAAAGVAVKLVPGVGVVEERIIVQGSVAQVYEYMADFSNTQRYKRAQSSNANRLRTQS
jgi:hypothetical protein